MNNVDYEWKQAFLIHCMAPVAETISSANLPDYQSIWALDEIIRGFPLPEQLDIFHPAGACDGPFHFMQQAYASAVAAMSKCPIPYVAMHLLTSAQQPFTVSTAPTFWLPSIIQNHSLHEASMRHL